MSQQKDYLSRTGPDYIPTSWGRFKTARAKYKFSVDGGAATAITPKENELIPDNAIIFGGFANSTVAATSSAGMNISIGTTAGSSATALLGATAKANFSTDAVIALVPTLAVPVKMTAAGYIKITIDTTAATAGEIEIVVMYYTAKA